MPKLKQGKKSSLINRTERMRNRNRGAQVSMKPGIERQDGVRSYIQKHTFDSSQDTDKHVLFNKLKNSVRTIPKNSS